MFPFPFPFPSRSLRRRRSIRRLKTSPRKLLVAFSVASSVDGSVRDDHPAPGRGVLVRELTLDIGNIGEAPEESTNFTQSLRRGPAAANHVLLHGIRVKESVRPFGAWPHPLNSVP